MLASWFYKSLPLFSIPFSATMKVTICFMASVQDLVSTLLIKAFIMSFFAWNVINIFLAGNEA